MATFLFDRFSAMVASLPARAVVSATKLECQMLKDDLARKRTMPIDEVSSIIAFCNFLENGGGQTSAVTVPIHHLGFYRATVKRLAESGELPPDAIASFDTIFSASGFKSLKAA